VLVSITETFKVAFYQKHSLSFLFLNTLSHASLCAVNVAVLYSENFNSADGDWLVGYYRSHQFLIHQWQWGNPTKTVINSSYDGNCWYTSNFAIATDVYM
jgi:hypothetical protein